MGQTAAQVEKAQELFERIAREKQKQAERKQVLEKAEQMEKRAQNAQLQQEEQTGLWKTQMEALQTVDKRQVLWEQKHTEAEELLGDSERAWSVAKRDADSSEIRHGTAGALCKGWAGVSG